MAVAMRLLLGFVLAIAFITGGCSSGDNSNLTIKNECAIKVGVNVVPTFDLETPDGRRGSRTLDPGEETTYQRPAAKVTVIYAATEPMARGHFISLDESEGNRVVINGVECEPLIPTNGS